MWCSRVEAREPSTVLCHMPRAAGVHDPYVLQASILQRSTKARVSKRSDTGVRKTAEPVPSRLLIRRVSTVKERTIKARCTATTTSKAWSPKPSLKALNASVSRSKVAPKATLSSAGKASHTTRSTGMKAVSSPTSKAVSHLTTVGRTLSTTLVELVLVPPSSLLPLNLLPPEAKLL